MTALCRCVIPQAPGLDEVPLAALVDEKLAKNSGDGYRDHRLPPLRDAWRTGLAALDNESRARFKLPFASIEKPAQLALLAQIQRGELKGSAWQGMPSNLFLASASSTTCAALTTLVPRAWSEMGFGGPANPRGYVRMYSDRRDPWEAAEAKPGNEEKALRENRRAR